MGKFKIGDFWSKKSVKKCVSSGTYEKIQNWGFFGQTVSKNGHFDKNPVFEGFD